MLDVLVAEANTLQAKIGELYAHRFSSIQDRRAFMVGVRKAIKGFTGSVEPKIRESLNVEYKKHLNKIVSDRPSKRYHKPTVGENAKKGPDIDSNLKWFSGLTATILDVSTTFKRREFSLKEWLDRSA